MFNKLYSRTITFLKQNVTFIFSLILFSLLINFPIPYYIHTPGGLINISDKVEIENEYKQNGSFNLTYVSEIKGNLLTYITSYILPNWDLIKSEEVKFKNETEEEVNFRNMMLLEEANQNAVFLAYQRANKYINIKDQKHYIVYVDQVAKTDLKIKDEILEVNDVKIKDVSEYTEITRKAKIGEKLKIKVRTPSGQEKIKYIEVIEYKGLKITGIYFITKYDYIANPKISFNFKKSESGSSGGLMMALSIYNKLIEKDITKGQKIVGTGTIDHYGNVGEVSGIKYKIIGAVKNKADLFLVPTGKNYDEAIDLKEKNNYNIEIIKVKTFDDAINYLELMN